MAGLVGAGIGMAGSAIGAMGTIGAAKAQAKAARAQQWNDFNAAIYEQKVLQNQANEQRASSQQTSIWLGKQKDLAQSKLQANAAFGGGSATDTTVGQLGGQLQQVGQYQKGMTMYAGESRARGLEDAGVAGVYRAVNQGNMDVWKADQNAKAARMSAMGSLIGSAGGLFNALGNVNFG